MLTGIGADKQEAARETDKSLEEKEEHEIPAAKERRENEQHGAEIHTGANQSP